MHDRGYNPAEMPIHETEFSGPLHEPEAVAASRTVELHPYGRRAVAGEPVGVRVSVIRPDRRDTFARHVREVLGPAVQGVKPQTYASLRLLEPSRPDQDGTWSFVFLIDPAAPDEDLEAASIYEAFYGPDAAREHLRAWDDCHAGEQLVYRVTQTDW